MYMPLLQASIKGPSSGSSSIIPGGVFDGQIGWFYDYSNPCNIITLNCPLNSPYVHLTPYHHLPEVIIRTVISFSINKSLSSQTVVMCQWCANVTMTSHQVSLHEVLLNNSCLFWPLLVAVAFNGSICPPAILQLYILPACLTAWGHLKCLLLIPPEP